MCGTLHGLTLTETALTTSTTEYGTNDLNHVYLNDGPGYFYEDLNTGALTE
ncbi:MAG: hypothetical protein ACI9YU_001075 [Flavobacteriales bacterium]|jgi:hypothetical protein